MAGGRTLTVAAEGSAAYRSVQAAVDAANAGDTVLVSRGTYRETVNVPASKRGLTLKGATANAEDVVITYDNASGTPKPGGGTYGTAGSATATFSANDITVTGVTVQNTWERAAHPDVRDTQAVAVKAVETDGPWTDTGGFSWTSARFAGYANTGPGAGTGANRPQLGPDHAAAYTARTYLAGTDGWNPTG
ncbi:pectinesterase family protein [Streptomyces sp. NBC_01565]|nr:pectinesterase family protein [Streptomyces sp. NBC_01565]